MKEVKEGYKITELGEIPNEWLTMKLIDICNKADRYSFAGGPFGSNLKSEHYTDNGIRVIQLQNIGDGKFINEYSIYTSQEKADELESSNIYPEDILIAKMADPVARACIVPSDSERYLMCSDGIRVAIDKESFDNNYIMYSINSPYFRNAAIANSTGSTRLRIGLSELKKLMLAIPPLPEQQKIADILSTIDEQIDNVDRLIEKTKELKKGLMQQLLTKGIGHTEFKETEVGVIPKEWEVKKLGELFKLSSGNFLSQKNICEGPYAVYGGNGINGYHNQYLFQDEKIVIGRVGAKCGCVTKSLPKSWITDNALYIESKIIDFVDLYMFYVLEYLDLNKYANQSAQPVISGQKIYAIIIGLPCIEEQRKIAEILYETEELISKEEKKKDKLQQLKKGLMQQLLTGKIRVK